VIYVYAITDAAAPPPRRGLDDAELRTVGEDGLFAVVSEHAEAAVEGTEENLWTHEEVVEALLDAAAVLPLRFGSMVEDAEAVRALLDGRRREFEATLARVRGAVELGVRVALPDAEGAAVGAGARRAEGAGPGTAYMLSRLDRERRAADAVARIHGPLAGLARESVRADRSLDRFALTASYLVDIDRVDTFRALVDELADELDGATIVCTGPWPPYSFSSPGDER
jgi:hypothetical protein